MTPVGERSERLATITLAAYHEAMTSLRGDDAEALLADLGDVDAQAREPSPRKRLSLAGKLIAAAQLAGPERLPDAEVRDVVLNWVAMREAERDDAAPALEPRQPPEDEDALRLGPSLVDGLRSDGLGYAAWGVAAIILQHLIRPPVQIARGLQVASRLESLAAEALLLLHETPRAGDLSVLLAHAALRLRAVGDPRPVAWESDLRADWLHLAADLAAAHAAWAGCPAADSLRRALAGACDRLASSVVVDDPSRFARAAALAHADRSVLDAAVTALGLCEHPHDRVLLQMREEALAALLEGSSSALIGAWTAPAPS